MAANLVAPASLEVVETIPAAGNDRTIDNCTVAVPDSYRSFIVSSATQSRLTPFGQRDTHCTAYPVKIYAHSFSKTLPLTSSTSNVLINQSRIRL